MRLEIALMPAGNVKDMLQDQIRFAKPFLDIAFFVGESG